MVIDENVIKKKNLWNKLLCILLYCLRFIKIRVKKTRVIRAIQPEELRESELAVIKITQAIYWLIEINSLSINENKTITI